MKTLCDHLRADEHVCFVGSELHKQLFVAVFLFCGVFVHAQCANSWKKSVERSFYMLCPKSFELKRFDALTVGTLFGGRHFKETHVAREEIGREMKGERQIAVGAFE